MVLPPPLLISVPHAGSFADIIRLAPPLVITAEQVKEATAIIERELARVFG